MSQDARKRQRKTERRNAKRKERQKEVARLTSGGRAAELERASRYPILHAKISAGLWDSGMGYALLSRQLPNGEVAFANFLLDVRCLGVKDTMFRIVSGKKYEETLEGIHQNQPMEKCTPEKLRKIVEDSVDYAKGFDLHPHRDYRMAKLLFGNIDPTGCTEEFEFGLDGRPCYIMGPYDSPARVAQITAALRAHCGEGNFDSIGFLGRVSHRLDMHDDHDDLDDHDEQEDHELSVDDHALIG